MINFLTLKESLSSLLQGAVVSLEITAIALTIGIIGGTLLALVLLYGTKVMRLLAQIYVTIFRGTPMLVQMVMLFFILPSIGIVLPAFWSAVLAISLNSIAYISQIVRAGIQAVGRGQVEAAYALGFSPAQAIRFIILPQAFRTVLPALGNECTTLIKESSLASVIGVAELNHQGSIIMSRTYDALTTYVGVALIYLLMITCASLLFSALERKISYVKH